MHHSYAILSHRASPRTKGGYPKLEVVNPSLLPQLLIYLDVNFEWI